MAEITTQTLVNKIFPKITAELDAANKNVLTRGERTGNLFREINHGELLVEESMDEQVMQASYLSEGGIPNEVDVRDGFTARRQMRQYGCQLRVSPLVKKFQKMDLIAKARAEMVRTPDNTFVALCLMLLELGHDATLAPRSGGTTGVRLLDLTAIDRLSFFNTAHIWKNSHITNANRVAYMSMSETMINNMANVPLYWLTPNGEPMGGRVTGVAVPVGLRHETAKFFKSKGQVDTAATATINTVREDFGDMDYTVIRELTNSATPATYWKTDIGRPPRIMWGFKPETTPTMDNLTQSDILQLRFMLLVNALDWRSMIRNG